MSEWQTPCLSITGMITSERFCGVFRLFASSDGYWSLRMYSEFDECGCVNVLGIADTFDRLDAAGRAAEDALRVLLTNALRDLGGGSHG